jgi:uncharacterized protein (DUF2235 family)
MVKRIAIFCDGTWNRHDSAHPTNVVRLAQAVAPMGDDGLTQVVLYVMGVGTGRGAGAVARATDRFLGGALGWGLLENIEEAYRALIFTYEPGDHLYIFGFSRGAYTARSLAGLIRSCGIPPADHLHLIGQALARYRTRGRPETRPDDLSSFAFRADFAPYTVTSEAEWDWRMTHRPGLCVRLEVDYLGVWDTVGALGIPGTWSVAPILNAGHQFHDTALSRSVRAARHAVAVDERRTPYEPALWSNLDDLNRAALGLAPGHDLITVPRDRLRYREEWFPGNHAALGGSGEVRGLSAITFDWIAQGAMAEGLSLRPEALARARAERDLTAPLDGRRRDGWIDRIMRARGRDRAGPDSPRAVAAATADRVRADPAYRPGALTRVLGALLPR